MKKAVEVRSGGHLLCKVSPDGFIEVKRGDWLHRIDIAETLRTGQAVVTRVYAGGAGELLTRPLDCGKISRN